MWEAQGDATNLPAVVIKKINSTLQKFLKSSGSMVDFSTLPKISVDQVSEILPTANEPSVYESSTDKSDRTLRSSSAKSEDKKNNIENRSTSKNYHY